MRLVRSCRVALLALTAMLGTAGSAWSKPAGPMGAARADAVIPGLVVVKVRAGTELLDQLSRGLPSAFPGPTVLGVEAVFPRTGLHKAAEADSLRLLLDRLFFLRINSEEDPRRTAAVVSQHPDVEYAEPKYLHRLDATPDDPGLPSQLAAFSQLRLFDGWSVATGSREVVIAVIDGGTYWPHEDLSGNLWINTLEDLNGNGLFDPGDEDGIDQDGNGFEDDVIGWNFANGSNDPRGLTSTPQSHSHGTATASHFGAKTNNGIGMAGTSWNAALMPVCASTPTGDNLIAYGYEGIIYAALQGATVINCSWGRLGGFSAFEQDVIRAVTAGGALIVAAVGNSSVDIDLQPHYPSSYNGVLSVGGTNSDSDQKAGFSNYGANVRVFAPAVNIWSALTNGLYGLAGSGTSYSSSLVAGIAGLLRSYHPSWTPDQVAAQIRVTADPIDGDNPVLAGKLGRGRVNAGRALTESHPGLEIVSSDFQSATGSAVLLVGDTVIASFHVRNTLFVGAGATTFSLSAGDPVLEILEGARSISGIGPGEETVLPTFTFKVGPTSLSKSIALRLEWAVTGEPVEARAFIVNVFPSIPSWAQQESPTNLPLFTVKAVSREVAWAAGGNQTGTSPVVLRTTDGGSTWEPARGTLASGDFYCITAIDASRAWVGSGDGRIFATSDGGTTWAQQDYPDPQSSFINGIWFLDPLNGFAQGDPPSASTPFVVLRTTDGGESWTHVPAPPLGGTNEYGWNNSFWWTDIGHGWFGTNSNRVWRTSDGGLTWTWAASGSTSSLGVAFRDSLTGFVAHGDGTVAMSTDGGQSWRSGGLGAGVGLVAASTLPGGTHAWVATVSTPFQTADLGASWSAQATYPLAGDISHISFAAVDRGWAATSGGELLRFDPGNPTSVESPVARGEPLSFRLEQNYPNPFNPRTTISYMLPAFSRVRLSVVDLLGRPVRSLVDEEQRGGAYRVEFDASGLASGVYFSRLEATPIEEGAAVIRTRPMVLLR